MAINNMYFLKTDYSQANSQANGALLETKTQLMNMSSRISSYVTRASNVLEGQAYSVILGRLKVYASAYEFLSNAIDVALNNIESGNNSVINAMGSFSELSGEKIEEIESEIAREKSLYYSMNSKIQSYTDEQEKKNAIAINNNRYAQISELERQKTELEEALINTNNADAEGASSLTNISNTFVNFENCFIEQ